MGEGQAVPTQPDRASAAWIALAATGLVTLPNAWFSPAHTPVPPGMLVDVLEELLVDELLVDEDVLDELDDDDDVLLDGSVHPCAASWLARTC
jgi:hypothetical protein